MKKTLLSIAIIAVLPFGAMADYTYNYVNTPAKVANNGTVTMASYPPYAIATIEADDAEHIASTAYVKGAYNDAIAAINHAEVNLTDLHNYIDEELGSVNAKRVTVYTTWEDDTANGTTQVELSTAQ